ncbi:TonB-dependent receptor [Reichenbachiella carrageenanivorans]|uniref:TonB-dependent receptor n=1 Tax=Reichenbachiella carrageenanivorans TaxID=2979869 RepID=A0ABY6D540_9BACT|nr:TonB-dependent receptor [Reichenbachiella carrageenanivorans]UXX81280.1 TonB-dependent receptor [Reichenbachiella carrageenanivorans]
MIKLRQTMIRLRSLMKMSLMLVALISFSAQAQDKAVTGKVTSATTGEELPGVSVLVKGTNNGTVTNIEGNYSLASVPADGTLVFSFIGMKTEELVLGGRSVLDLSMEDDVTALEEVVVVGYSSQSKKTISSSVATLDTQEALKVPVSNASELLQGRVAGVTVVTASQPGDAPIVRIRGYGSTGNNDPLYVIDGVQLLSSSALSDLNVNDIKSVSVLKDAAAASIYGARASNGVIVVTTRKGTPTGKPVFTFDSYFGTQQPTNMPDMINSAQFGQLIYETELNDGIATPGHAHFSAGANPTVADYIIGDPNQPYDFDTNRLTKSSDGTDWFDEIFDPALIQNYYLSAAGGSEAGRYMMSLGYFNREGILSGTGLDRYTTRVNTDFNLSERVRVGQHFNLAYSEQKAMVGQFNDNNPISSAYRSSPILPAYDEGGNYAGAFSNTAELGNATNPVADMGRAATGEDKNRSIRFFGDAYLEIDILKNLTAKSSIGINYQSGKNNSFQWLNPEHSEPRSKNTLTETDYINKSWVWSNTLKYDLEIGDTHRLSALVGTEAIQGDSRQTQITQDDFMFETPDFFVLGAGTGDTNIDQGNTYIRGNSIFSVFGQLNYALAERYLASVTVRRDKSSRFNDGNNTGVFPAFSLGWIVSEESFLSGSSFISNLKLRGSYGEMGNQELPVANPNVTVSALNSQNSFYTFDGVGTDVGAAVSALGNADLTWETSSQIDFGVDFGFLNDDLTLTVDYFDIKTKDMILNPPLPATGSVATPPYLNVGEMQNKGLEFAIGYGNFSSSSDFTYDLAFNLSTYKNEITAINAAEGTSFLGASLRGNTVSRTAVGDPLASFYGREVIGIFQDAAEVSSAPDQGFATPDDGVGRFRYADVDGNNVIDGEDRKVIGNPHPDFTFGFNANIGYKNFDLSLFVTGSQGNEIYNFTKYFTDFPSFPNGGRSTRVLDAWSETNKGGSLPALSEAATASNGESSPNSYFVEDGSYVRLKNLQIGYTLPKNLISKIGLRHARVYVQGTNLITLTGYEGIDPEIGSIATGGSQNLNLGVDFGSFPVAKTYTMGLSIDF